MTLLVSDLIGGLAGIALAVPALKDQFYRFNRARETRLEHESPWPKLRVIVKQAWETRRNDFDGADSLFTAAGALGLVLSFVLKLMDR